MEIDINMIKCLLVILTASFVFACVAEAQPGKQLTIAHVKLAPLPTDQNYQELASS
ncbi:hypothetical protein [Mucilaginibacter pocheonensis]|uniref:Uncharacterized protein n=1 Tax=Mucilaginibacter pocheonensis TaxID=398050 RepID=A0ABU1TAL8_9SPHI|nr:hypothetical protein [Mucilaginibacter pocheonensis]MDR6942296.1 hypothetical protein [Mucilaginibacter pocheonensis]